MYSRYLNLVIVISSLIVGLLSDNTKNHWIMATDTTEDHPWWVKDMHISGNSSTYSLRQEKQLTFLKINLFLQRQEGNCMQIRAQFNASQHFQFDLFQTSLIAEFTFFRGKHEIKKWSNTSATLHLTINKGQMIISGQQFYIWIDNPTEQQVNFKLIIIISLVLIFKVILIIIYRKIFEQLLLAAGILIYTIIFSYGLRHTIQSLCFNLQCQSRQNYQKVGYLTIALIIAFYITKLYHTIYVAIKHFKNIPQILCIILALLGSMVFIYLGLIRSINALILVLYVLETNIIYFKQKHINTSYMHIFVNSIDCVLLVILLLNPTHNLQNIFLIMTLIILQLSISRLNSMKSSVDPQTKAIKTPKKRKSV